MKTKKHFRDFIRIFLAAVLICLLSGCSFLKKEEPLNLPEGSYFEVYFLDVGQGDSSLIICDGEAMLIDGGNSSQSSFIYSYLENHGITHLKYIIGTHPDADHIGGLPGALNYATVDVAFCSALEYDTKTFHNFVKYLDNSGVTLRIPDLMEDISLGSATGKIIGPVDSTAEGNNNSLVLRLEYGNTSFLFTGDAEYEEEKDILNNATTLKSTVLKVGHHGSTYSTSHKFLTEVRPGYAVISAGKDNDYGHPHVKTLSRLKSASLKLFRTDLQGTIICNSDGNDVKFSVEKNENADVFEATNSYVGTDEN